MRRTLARTFRFVWVTTSALLAGAVAAGADAPPVRTLLTHAWLIDGTGVPAAPDMWVMIEEDRIVDVGQGRPPHERATKVLDLTGKTVLPGLADMHFHLPFSREELPWQLTFALAHGVTVVRDVGTGTAYLEMPADEATWKHDGLGTVPSDHRAFWTARYHWDLLQWTRRWLEEHHPAPHLYSAGVMLYGRSSLKRFLLPGEGIRELIEGNLAVGVDFIKVHQWVSSEALSQAVALSGKRGLRVVGHVPTGMSSVGTIDAGIETLEHVRLRPWEVLDDPEVIARYPVDGTWPIRDAFWAHFDPEAESLERTLKAWEERKSRFFVDPTLVEWEWEICDYPGPDDPVLDLLPPAKRERVEDCSHDMTPRQVADLRATLKGISSFVGLAHRRGIRVLAGTDVWSLPGASLHRELELLVDAGLSPEEAIHASTGRAAEEIGTTDRGTIATGNVADLVIVRGNLAKDIGAVRAIETVILGGRFHDRAELLAEASRLARRRRP